MSASLVGSEMCIRDRLILSDCLPTTLTWMAGRISRAPGPLAWHYCAEPVSYTHLTLPTICSV
eukprot:10836917-Alexandrium_andersonii.AAC.1